MQIKCPNCGYEGKGKTITKGSLGLELFLWIFGIITTAITFGVGFLALIIPLIYSIWRICSRYRGCPKCKYQFVVVEIQKEKSVRDEILERIHK